MEGSNGESDRKSKFYHHRIAEIQKNVTAIRNKTGLVDLLHQAFGKVKETTCKVAR